MRTCRLDRDIHVHVGWALSTATYGLPVKCMCQLPECALSMMYSFGLGTLPVHEFLLPVCLSVSSFIHSYSCSLSQSVDLCVRLFVPVSMSVCLWMDVFICLSAVTGSRVSV